ncbi:unnamed protein product, partial [Allacma fusca]
EDFLPPGILIHLIISLTTKLDLDEISKEQAMHKGTFSHDPFQL